MAKFKGVAVDREFTRKWIRALESGKFEQTTSTLVDTYTDDDGTEISMYCCLGVACEVAKLPRSSFWGANQLDGQAVRTKIRHKLGLDTKWSQDLQDRLKYPYRWEQFEENNKILQAYFIGLNDDGGLNFKEIAKEARRILLGETV